MRIECCSVCWFRQIVAHQHQFNCMFWSFVLYIIMHPLNMYLFVLVFFLFLALPFVVFHMGRQVHMQWMCMCSALDERNNWFTFCCLSVCCSSHSQRISCQYKNKYINKTIEQCALEQMGSQYKERRWLWILSAVGRQENYAGNRKKHSRSLVMLCGVRWETEKIWWCRVGWMRL